jgi:hypothetical protein
MNAQNGLQRTIGGPVPHPSEQEAKKELVGNDGDAAAQSS